MNRYKYGIFDKYHFYKMFGTPIKQLLLKFFSENISKRYSVLDVQTQMDLPGSSVSVALSELEEEGVVEGVKEGKFKYYSLSKKLAEDFLAIFKKLDGIYQIALTNKKKRGNEIKEEDG